MLAIVALFLMQYRNYPKFIELSVYNFSPSNCVMCIEFIFNVTLNLARVLIYDDINEIELKTFFKIERISGKIAFHFIITLK